MVKEVQRSVKHVVVLFLQVVAESSPLSVLLVGGRNAVFSAVQRSAILHDEGLVVRSPCLVEFVWITSIIESELRLLVEI